MYRYLCWNLSLYQQNLADTGGSLIKRTDMTFCVEVCVDNLESLKNAQRGGADRIELCSALALGGLTPSYGLMQKAAAIAKIPVYAMIRPRQGDFLYSQDDIEQMLADIYAARQAKLTGVVVGALNPDGTIDQTVLNTLVNEAKELGVTFHRAVDHCSELFQGLDSMMSSGCERVLTSGQAKDAFSGAETIAEMVRYCGKHLSVMAGAGVNPDNVNAIIAETGVTEVHLSGKTVRPSSMKNVLNEVCMGSEEVDDFAIPVTDSAKIAAVVQNIKKQSML